MKMNNFLVFVKFLNSINEKFLERKKKKSYIFKLFVLLYFSIWNYEYVKTLYDFNFEFFIF